MVDNKNFTLAAAGRSCFRDPCKFVAARPQRTSQRSFASVLPKRNKSLGLLSAGFEQIALRLDERSRGTTLVETLAENLKQSSDEPLSPPFVAMIAVTPVSPGSWTIAVGAAKDSWRSEVL